MPSTPEVTLKQLPSGVALVTVKLGKRSAQDVVAVGEDPHPTIAALTQDLQIEERMPKPPKVRRWGPVRPFRGGSRPKVYEPRPCPVCGATFTPIGCKQKRCTTCPPTRKAKTCPSCDKRFFPANGIETALCPKCTRPKAPDECKVVIVWDSVLGIDRRKEFGFDEGPPVLLHYGR